MRDSLRAMIVLGLCVTGIFATLALATVRSPPLFLAAFPFLAASFCYAGYRVERPDGLRHQRAAAGLCHACGYDLTGNASGVCPECGNGKPRN